MAGETTVHYLKRTAVSDANLQTGRYARLGTGKAAEVEVSVAAPQGILATSITYRGGPFCRYVDTSNWLMLVRLGWNGVEIATPRWHLIKRVGGVETRLAIGKYYVGLDLAVRSNGVCIANGVVTPPDADLKTGGALAEGGFGIYDAYTSAGALTRKYDAFSATIQAPATMFDAVLYANRAAKLSSQGMFRQSQDGLAYGPVGVPGSDLPRIPVSGPEKRPVEIALKQSRGDFGDVADSGLDWVSGQLAYRPAWSFIPES
jgi:hypothetical protein